MPAVQRVQQEVQPGGVPAVRMAGDIATADVGAPLRATAQAADQAARLAQQEKQKADDAWTQQTYAEMLRQKNNLLHGEGGALRKQGRDAMAAIPTTQDAFEKYADELEKGANNETQRQAILNMRLREATELRSSLQRHAAQETERLEDEAFKVSTESLHDDSVLNPERAQANLAIMLAAANDYADRKGWTGQDEETQALRKNLTEGIESRVHAGIIMAKLRAEDDLGAKAYFDENKDAIKDARLMEQVKSGLEEGGLRGEGQRRVDWLLKRFEDLGPAREWIRENLTGKLRDEVDRRARDEYGLRAAQVRQDQEAAFVAGYNYLAQTGKLPVVGSPEWKGMSPYQRERLAEYANKRGEVKEDDDRVLVRFMGMPPNKLASLTEAQLLEQARPKLTDASFHRVLGMWKDAREALAGGRGSKKEADVKSLFNDKELVLNGLKASGLFPENTTLSQVERDPDMAATFRKFADSMDDEFARLQREGKKLGDDERKAIINKRLVQKVFVDKDWAKDREKPLALLTDEERQNAYVPMSRIPEADLGELINSARSAGALDESVTDEKAKVLMKDRLQRAYGAFLTGANRERILLILSGGK